MRTITLIIIHCSAVRPGQTSSAAQIDSWHRKDNHWKFGIGYHYVVRRDGSIEPGRPEWMVGAHCLNHNAHSIGVCYEGGLDIRGQPADTRTEAQKTSLRTLLEELHRRYPKALIVGHRDRFERCSSLLPLDNVSKLPLYSLNRSLQPKK